MVSTALDCYSNFDPVPDAICDTSALSQRANYLRRTTIEEAAIVHLAYVVLC